MTPRPLQVGMAFNWMRDRVHVVLLFEHSDKQHAVLSRWDAGNRRWAYFVEPVWLIEEMRAKSTDKDIIS